MGAKKYRHILVIGIGVFKFDSHFTDKQIRDFIENYCKENDITFRGNIDFSGIVDSCNFGKNEGS